MKVKNILILHYEDTTLPEISTGPIEPRDVTLTLSDNDPMSNISVREGYSSLSNGFFNIVSAIEFIKKEYPNHKFYKISAKTTSEDEINLQ